MGLRLATIAVCSALALAAQPEHSLQVTTTDKLDYAGGVIRVDNAYGQLNVEGWDEPRVEVTVTRTAFRHNTPKEQESGNAYLNQIRVTSRKASNGDLEISTQFPGRNRFVRAIWGLGDFNLDYRIKVPRNARLNIHHGVGDVIVHDVAGDIDATVRTGDIVLELPDPEKYAIDAQCRFGGIFTDYDGTHRSPWLVGQKLEGGNGRKIRLRVALGGITIQRVPVTPYTN